jgi:RNA polymerase sigma-70 factor (subfamily 1)
LYLVIVELLRWKGVPSPKWSGEQVPRQLSIEVCHPTSSVAARLDYVLFDLLRKARCGSAEALGELFEACRGYLVIVAHHELPGQLRAKIDSADVVQETFIETMRDFATFRGQTGQQLRGWLRGILRHNLADVDRHFEYSCRFLSHEVPMRDLRAAVRKRAFRTAGGTIGEQLVAREQRRALDAALERLPPAYREVIRLHYGERRGFAEIGTRLQRSAEAVRKMACRAVERLRQDMCDFAEA